LSDFGPPCDVYIIVWEFAPQTAGDHWLSSDVELFRCIQSGDRAALGILYERYLPSVWRYVHAQVGTDRQIVEDIVSETFLAAVREIRRLDLNNGTFSGWLTGVARHKLADHRGRLQHARDAERAIRHHAAEKDRGQDGPAIAEIVEIRAQVRSVIEQMPSEERLALEWKYLENLSVREIAGRLGRTEKAIESILYRARASFRLLFPHS
jgi:RNA polymerase sigma-70 factor (ECF subfamily)